MSNHSRSRRAPYLSVALAAAVALSLSGCGTVNKTDNAKKSAASVTSAAKALPSAKVVYEQMRKNVTAAKSVRIKGEITNAGKQMKIDIAGDRDGKNTRAMMNDGTGQVELLTARGSVYLKADAAYWTKNASAAVAKVAAGKYLKIPAGTGAGVSRSARCWTGPSRTCPLPARSRRLRRPMLTAPRPTSWPTGSPPRRARSTSRPTGRRPCYAS